MAKMGPEFAAEVFLRGGSLVHNGYRVTVNSKMGIYYVRALNKFEKNPELTKEQLKDYLLSSEKMKNWGCTGLRGWVYYTKPNGERVLVTAPAACVGKHARKSGE